MGDYLLQRKRQIRRLLMCVGQDWLMPNGHCPYSAAASLCQRWKKGPRAVSERVSKVAYLGEDLGATWGQLGFNLGGQIGDNFAHLALVFFASSARRAPKQ